MNRALPDLVIEGAAFFASRLPSWDIARAVIRGERNAPAANAPRPAPTLLAPTERRRAPDTVAVALEVASRACEAAARQPQDLACVFAATHGDLAISDYMCATLAATPTLLSPTKFHNSVHNAAAGYWSIGVGSYAPYTAISAHRFTFGVGLLEAATQALCENAPVLYVAYDIEAKGPLAAMAPSRGLMGVALVLAPVEGGRGRRLGLRLLSAPQTPATPARSPAAALVQDNAMAPALPFFESFAHDQSAELVCAVSEQLALHVHLREAPHH